jgi:hypothetical protein
MANLSGIFCLNGHYVDVVNRPIRARSSAELRHMMERASQQEPQKLQAYCTECGAQTIESCTQCNTPILYRFPGDRASYCSGCGKPFPWTETAINAAREFTDELDLSEVEKVKLKDTFADLTADTARTEVAAHRFKNFMKKVGPAAGDVLTKIMVNVATEAAKKGMGM